MVPTFVIILGVSAFSVEDILLHLIGLLERIDELLGFIINSLYEFSLAINQHFGIVNRAVSSDRQLVFNSLCPLHLILIAIH